MNDMFRKLVDQKRSEGKGFSPVEKTASDNVLSDLMNYLNGLEGDKVKGMKKVTVSSNDPKGLEEGLAKAKAMVGKDGMEEADPMSEEMVDDESDENSEDMPSSDDTADELATHEASDQDNMEDLKRQIEMLKSQLASKGGMNI